MRVAFPVLGLNMAEYCFCPEKAASEGEAAIYDLCAVCVHRGTALSAGHYVAYGRSPTTGQWLLYDDAAVSAVAEHEMVREASEDGYMLFYASRAAAGHRG